MRGDAAQWKNRCRAHCISRFLGRLVLFCRGYADAAGGVVSGYVAVADRLDSVPSSALCICRRIGGPGTEKQALSLVIRLALM